MERRLAAILSADVVGYARLMSEDEAGTLAALKAHREELIEPKIAEHHGRIVKLMGDGLLAEFPSAVEAVQCAVEVQHYLGQLNADVLEDRRITYRIGINIGDIVVEDEDIYGDGVNVAARLESLANTGGICVARNIFNQVRDKLDLTFEHLGEKKVKNIAEPVSVYRINLDDKAAALVTPVAQATETTRQGRWPAIAAGFVLSVLGIAGLVWWQPWVPDVEPASVERMAFPLPDKPSIAVLPFVNMSDDPEEEYFADGIAEDLITDLSRISGLFVIARNSTFAYKGRSVAVRQVSEDLGVRYVLEGSVRRDGDQVRINARLIDATSGGHLWAERYDGEMSGVFALQDKVTNMIVAALAVQLTREESERTVSTETDYPEAYDAFLQGWSYYVRDTPEDFAKAIPYFETAVELDPEYGRPYAALASLYHLIWTRNWRDIVGLTRQEAGYRPHRSLTLAFEYLDEALKRPTPLAHAVAARIDVIHRKNFEDAFAHATRAVALNPNDPIGHLATAHVLTMAGKPKDALSFVTNAFRLDPHNSASYLFVRGLAQFGAEDYERAAESFEKTIELSPHFGAVPLIATYGYLGRDQEARETIAAATKRWQKDEPGFPFTIRQVTRYLQYEDPSDTQRLADGLRKAGMQ